MSPFIRNFFTVFALIAAAVISCVPSATAEIAATTAKAVSATATVEATPSPAAAEIAATTAETVPSPAAAETTPASLEAMLLLSTQYAVQDMYFLSPPQFPPRLQTADTLYVGQSVLLVPIVQHYAVSEAGEIDVRYRPTSVLPDGQTEDDLGELPIYIGKAPEGMPLLFPTRALDSFYAGENQGVGTFILRVQIKDHISGESRMLEQPINVIPYEVPDLPADFDADNWMLHYYAAPSPQFALPALFALMANADADQLNRTTAPLLGFYDRVLANNRWLLPHFSSRLEASLNKVNQGGTPNAADVMLGLVLSFHLRDAKERPEQISERIWLETESNRHYDWGTIEPAKNDFIHYPQQLDYLWGQFFASGSYPPIYRLLGVLFQDEAATATATGALQKLSQEQRDALAEAVLASTRWSLMSNATRHRLVMAYLFGTFFNENNELSATQREELHILLSAILQAQRSENTLETVIEKNSATSEGKPPNNTH